MSTILAAVEKLAKRSIAFGWDSPAIVRYLETGDEAALNEAPSLEQSWATGLCDSLPGPGDWTEQARRIIILTNAKKHTSLAGNWLRRFCHHEISAWQDFAPAVQCLLAAGMSEGQIRSELLTNCNIWDAASRRPTPAGEFLSQNITDEEIYDGINAPGNSNEETASVVAYADPDRLERLLAEGLIDSGIVSLEPQGIYRAMAVGNPGRFAARAFECYQALDGGNLFERIRLITLLADLIPELYGKPAFELTTGCLAHGQGDDAESRFCAEHLLKHHHPGAVPLICAWMSRLPSAYDPVAQRERVLKAVAAQSPADALLMAQACARCPAGSIALLGVRHWLALGLGNVVEPFAEALRGLLGNAEEEVVIEGVAVARDWDLARMQADVWPLTQHQARSVCGAAARALGGLGYGAVAAQAQKLLQHASPEIRRTAVTLLSQAGSTEAASMLKQHLDIEEADEVRDDIILALDRLGCPFAPTPEEQQARIAKTLAVTKTKAAPVRWITLDSLVFKRQDGSTLTREEVLYLLLRQSRCKEMRADLEARPLYAALDRAASGGTAVALLQAYLGGKQAAADRWVLVLAALSGDDRLVPPLRKSVLDWVELKRNKLAEAGVQALALLGTQAALMVVDSISVRFQAKNKNISEAAADAFADAAEARGVTVDELGDLVVPWLGFEPGQPRLVDTAKGQVEVRIQAGMKLAFHEVKTGKALAKLPTSSPAEIQAEFKVLSATLKEAVKAQTLRMENLLVRLFRWPVARWLALYSVHPLLRPFTQRLVWVWQDDDGLRHTFRAASDGSFVDVLGRPFVLPEQGGVSLVHPLDLTAEARAAWFQHLADHHVTPPFAQLDRPVLRVRPEEAAATMGGPVYGTNLNVMTFRGRAERLGWSRGSTIDGGSIISYRKVFSGAGVDAFLMLESLHLNISPEESIELRDVYFVKSGAVQVGSYSYDEPVRPDDPRLIPFAQVPEVPFSETMGDLAKISGKAPDESDQAAADALEA